jgi:hypothetical protein
MKLHGLDLISDTMWRSKYCIYLYKYIYHIFLHMQLQENSLKIL